MPYEIHSNKNFQTKKKSKKEEKEIKPRRRFTKVEK